MGNSVEPKQIKIINISTDMEQAANILTIIWSLKISIYNTTTF
jgi:hypothetical protein